MKRALSVGVALAHDDDICHLALPLKGRVHPDHFRPFGS